MELSTSIPTPIASPASEIIFKVTPEKYIRTMAKITLSGMLTAVISVGRRSRRNTSRITIARIAPKSRFCSTELITI